MHDDGFTVGFYGDKAWAQWIMVRLRDNESMGCFGRFCHSSYSMQLITNQDVGDAAAPWLDWWRKNQSKSQEEWLADGFAQHGVRVSAPPTAEQTEALLTILSDKEGEQGTSIPDNLKYNAFRWLRDTGFDPIEFALTRKPVSAVIERGLMQYSQFQHRWPAALKLGILTFGKTDEPGDASMPSFLNPDFQAAAYAIIFFPLVVGFGLLFISMRRTASPASPANPTCCASADDL